MDFLEQPAHPKGPAFELSQFLDEYRQKNQNPPLEAQPKPSGGPVTRKVRELMSGFSRKADPIPDAWDVEPAPEPPVLVLDPEPVPEPTPEPPKVVISEATVQIPERNDTDELTEKISSLADLVNQLAVRDTPKTQGRRKLIVRRDTEGRISSIEEDD